MYMHVLYYMYICTSNSSVVYTSKPSGMREFYYFMHDTFVYDLLISAEWNVYKEFKDRTSDILSVSEV